LGGKGKKSFHKMNYKTVVYKKEVFVDNLFYL